MCVSEREGGREKGRQLVKAEKVKAPDPFVRGLFFAVVVGGAVIYI